MRLSTIILSVLIVVGCVSKDRPQILREKIIGQWREVNRDTQRFGFDVALTVTDSIVFMTDQPGYFYAKSYEISPLDSITFYEFHGDTLTFKMIWSDNDDTLKLRTNDRMILGPSYLKLLRTE
jgi:hypothetical protein